MDIVIPKNETQGHIINKYKFKVLATGEAFGEPKNVSDMQQPLPEQGAAPAAPIQEPVPHAAHTGRDELVESLLKKTDDISSNFIKMQMKLEEQEEMHKAELEALRASVYEEGIAAGRAQMQEELQSMKNSAIDQFAASVKTLEASAADFSKGLDGIRGELLYAALDIAKEVVKSEIGERSGEIAKTLSEELIASLQEASKVTLRVNPADHGAVSERVGSLGHVEVISDSAVSPGGVIAISDAGNMDAEIMKRYERVKRAALSG